MSRPTWISLAAIGIGNVLLRRMGSALDSGGFLDEIESIIEYHAPKPEADAVAQVHEMTRLQRRLDDIKANVVIG